MSANLPPLPEPVDFSDVPSVAHVWGYTADQMRSLQIATRNAALEEAAKVADSFVDAAEERRAHMASNMRDGTIGDQIRSLKHHQTVSMWNAALRKVASAIRAMKDKP